MFISLNLRNDNLGFDAFTLNVVVHRMCPEYPVLALNEYLETQRETLLIWIRQLWETINFLTEVNDELCTPMACSDSPLWSKDLTEDVD